MVVPHGKFDSANQKHYPDLGSDTSSVWNSVLISQTSFGGETSGSVAKCHFTGKPVVASPNVISRGNQWWRHEMLAVFSG